MSIPRIIHQTTEDKERIPAEFGKGIDRLRELNPGWEYRLYDRADRIQFIAQHCDRAMLRRYFRLNPFFGAARADLFRYLVVYRFGGVYLDIKSTMSVPLDDVLLPDDEYLLSNWNNAIGSRYERWGMHPGMPPRGEYQQWHIVAAAGHPFLRRAIAEVSRRIDAYSPLHDGTGWFSVLKTTGPIAYTHAILGVEQEHRHRLVDVEQLGFIFSSVATLGDQFAHRKHAGVDQATLSAPIVTDDFRDADGKPLNLIGLGRNAVCPCGSGLKAKRCHGLVAA
jgi:hypothetical protein